jgi:ribosomal protein S18 acetylase RimI-like enzyme
LEEWKIVYKTSLDEVDWARLKETLAADNFDNGRTPEQLRLSFQNSYAAVIVYDGDRIVGTARVLSDGVCNAYVIDVWTLSQYRRRGIARTMMSKLEEKLEGQHIYLFSEDMPEFYKKLDFLEQPTGLSKVKGKWLVNRES